MAPASGYVVPDSLPDRILTALAERPAQRSMDLSRALFPDPAATSYRTRARATMAVGAECARLYRTGLLLRTVQRVPDRKLPITRYSLPAAAPAATT